MNANEVFSYLSETYWIILEIQANKKVLDNHNKWCENALYFLRNDCPQTQDQLELKNALALKMRQNENTMFQHIRQLMDHVDTAQKMIDLVSDPVGRTILSKRFIDGLKCEEIADSMFYCRTSVYNITINACKQIAASLPNDFILSDK